MPGPPQVDRAWERLDLPVMAAPFTAEMVVVAPTVLPAAVAMVVMLMRWLGRVARGQAAIMLSAMAFSSGLPHMISTL